MRDLVHQLFSEDIESMENDRPETQPQPTDEAYYCSVLLWLEPRNEQAKAILEANRHKQNRVTSITTEPDMTVDMIQINLTEPKQRRGFLTFGRHPGCSISLCDSKISLEHCYIDINKSSLELLLCHTSRNSTTWLDGEAVQKPPKRAMIYGHSTTMKIRSANFKIHWPKISDKKMEAYRRSKLTHALRQQDMSERFDLTDLEWDIESVAPTVAGTRPPSRPLTPFREQVHDGSPVKVEELGRGAFGTLYRAVDRISGDFVAVKKFHDVKRGIASFQRELKMIVNLRH